ncbi:sugar ABC transporter permease, partial [Streptomyces sp. McG6]|nr:sugar ABC transporter permease [Streptomyces sp. McG6]
MTQTLTAPATPPVRKGGGGARPPRSGSRRPGWTPWLYLAP